MGAVRLTKGAGILQSQEDVDAFISACRFDSQYEKAIKIIEDVINTTGKKIPAEEKERLLNAIKSRSALKALLPN